MSELSEVFWTFFITSIIGLCLGAARICYKSKCKEVDLCCLKVIRDVTAEEKVDELETMNKKEKVENSE